MAENTKSSSRQDNDRTGVISPSSREYAVYIRDMVFDLRSMAERNNMMLLAYFLDMAHEEASNQAKTSV